MRCGRSERLPSRLCFSARLPDRLPLLHYLLLPASSMLIAEEEASAAVAREKQRVVFKSHIGKELLLLKWKGRPSKRHGGRK